MNENELVAKLDRIEQQLTNLNRDVVMAIISIHAPVKGATAFKLAQSLSALSSIILRTD